MPGKQSLQTLNAGAWEAENLDPEMPTSDVESVAVKGFSEMVSNSGISNLAVS